MLSTPKAKLNGMDISNMYLNTPLDRFEYMQIPYSNFPPDIIEHYNLASKVAADGFINIEFNGPCTASSRLVNLPTSSSKSPGH